MPDGWIEEPTPVGVKLNQYGVVARVVANGIAGDKLKVTVCLSPGNVSATGKGPALRDWPQAIESLLLAVPGSERQGSLKIVLAPVKQTDGKPEPVLVVASRRLQGAAMPSLYAEWTSPGTPPATFYVLELWRKLMAPKLPNVNSMDWWLWLDRAVEKIQDSAARKDDCAPSCRREAAFNAPLYRAKELIDRLTYLSQRTLGLNPDAIVKECGHYKVPTEASGRRWFLRRTDPQWASKVDTRSIAAVLSDDLAGIVDEFRHHLGRSVARMRRRRHGQAQKRIVSAAHGRSAQRSMTYAPVEKDDSQLNFREHARAIALEIDKPIQYQQDRVDAHHEFWMTGTGVPMLAQSTHCGPFDDDEKQQIMRRRLLAAESMPVLGRLLNFTIDLEIPLTAELKAKLTEFPAGHIHLSADLGADVQDPRPMQCLAKYRGDTGYFWPSTQEELENAENPGQAKPLEMQDAVYNLRLGCADGCPRYDVGSVDALQSIESDQNSRLQMKDRSANPNNTAFLGPERPALRTKGLMLIDGYISDKLCDRADQAGVTSPVDARTMAIGYRLDVGMRLKPDQPEITWRALNDRDVKYDDPTVTPQTKKLENAIERLWFAKGARIALDATNIQPAVKVVPAEKPKPEEPEDIAREHRRQLAADEILATWQGELVGVECRSTTEILPAFHDFAVGKTITPLSPDMKTGVDLPPRLQFGWRYFFGMRPVFNGGDAMPLDQAATGYDAASLPDTRTSGRRVLRHERIDAPMLAIPYDVVRRTIGDKAYEVDPAATAILRKSDIDTWRGKELNVDWTSRVLMAPNVTLEFSDRHGAIVNPKLASGKHDVRVPLPRDPGAPPNTPPKFKRVTVPVENVPADGLRGVVFEATPNGGFPVLKDGGKTDYLTKTDDYEQHNDQIKYRGDAIFKLQMADPNSAANRILPYYPDPAAASMMLALRYRDGDRGFLAGEPIEVPLYKPNGGYASALPVRIDIHARQNQRTSTEPLSHADVIAADADGSPDDYSKVSSIEEEGQASVDARLVNLWLAPGEDFDLVAWCVPAYNPDKKVNQIAGLFDLVESVALLALSTVPLPPPATKQDVDEDCIKGLKTLIPGWSAILDDWFKNNRPPSPAFRNVGAASLPLPSDPVLQKIAAILSETIRKQPLPELASVRVLRVVHAVSKPEAAPSFASPVAEGQPDKSNRVAIAAARRLFRGDGNSTAAEERDVFITTRPFDTWAADTAINEDGACDALLGGVVWAEMDTTGVVGVECRTPSPLGRPLDDPSRRRTEQAQRDFVQKGTLDPDASKVYGFGVDAQGKASFEATPVTLMRFNTTQPRRSYEWNQPLAGLEPLDLLLLRDEQRGPVIPLKRARDLTERHLFQDPRARTLRLTPQAYTRFKEHFTVRSALLPAGSTGPAWSFRSDADVTGQASLILPATMRPARVDEKGLLPAFVWAQSTFTDSGNPGIERRRTMKIRLRLRRPWFSSGEYERFGLVLWPPQLFTKTNDEVARYDPTLPGEPSRGSGDDWKFTDDILRGGGGYITRWGADPIRSGAGPDGWFMPPEVFLDVDSRNFETGPSPQPSDFACQYVPRVKMPIPRSDDDDGKTQQYLDVALLTFEPRFDVVEENWYVDLTIGAQDIPHPFVRLGLVRYQENAREDLRVSEPVTEWIQLLPNRRAAAVIARADGDGLYPIEVTVSGVGYYRSAALSPTGVADEDLLRLFTRHRPAVRMHLLKRDQLFGGEEIIDSWESRLDHRQPLRSPEGMVWTHTFKCPTDPHERSEFVYAVVVEEFDLMQPSDYPKEGETMKPIDEGKAELRETGPKFFCRLDIRVPK